jgi:hypothetical protein
MHNILIPQAAAMIFASMACVGLLRGELSGAGIPVRNVVDLWRVCRTQPPRIKLLMVCMWLLLVMGAAAMVLGVYAWVIGK